MKHLLAPLTFAVWGAVPALLAAQSGGPWPGGGVARSDVDRAALGISAPDLSRGIGVIAHDSMRGRDTPSPGLEATARWIAGEFSRFGLEGGGDGGSFLQRYPLHTLALDWDASGVTAAPGGKLAFGADVLPVLLAAPAPARGTGAAVVISGTGGLDAVRDWDLRGRSVVLVLPEPLPGGQRVLLTLLQTLRSRQVASVLLASPSPDADWNRDVDALRSERFPGGRELRDGSPPVFRVRDRALARVLGPRGVDLAALRRAMTGELRRTDVPGLNLSVTQQVSAVTETAPNVVAILEGSDPDLRDEYVVFSAHMDHVGVGTPDARGDSIYNGADDDASGTITVVEVAEAMASLETSPKRSMIFLLVSGEEKGLWGSSHFVDHPPVPLEEVVANLNIDMVGRNWADTIVAIGRQQSDLGSTLARVNAAHPELRMTAIDDPWPQERFYFRSDHYNFARNGVPVLFFFSGTHDDYHRPSDAPEKIDAEKTSRIGRLVFYLGLEIGNAPARPQWDAASYREIVPGARRSR